MSANTGVAPACTTAAAVAAKVSDGSMTSSPGCSPIPTQISCSAAVPLETATAWPAPTCVGERPLERRHLRALREPARAVDAGDGLHLGVGEPNVAERNDPIGHRGRHRHGVSSARGFLGRSPDAGHRRRWLHRRPSRGGAAQSRRNVRALCRYNSRGDRGTLDWFSPRTRPQIEVRFGDLRDPESVRQAMAGIEVAFHLGAQIAIPYSFINPRDFFETNVGGTLNVAQAALASRRRNESSTSRPARSTATPRRLPITERQPPAPRSPYAASKVGADVLMTSFCRVVRASGGDRAAVQHVRPAPVGARDRADDRDPGAARRARPARPARAAPRPDVRAPTRSPA